MAEDYFSELGLVTDPKRVQRPQLVTEAKLAEALEKAEANQETVGFLGGLGIAGSEGVAPMVYEFGRRQLTDANKPIKILKKEDQDFLIGSLIDPQAKLDVLQEARNYGMERATLLKTSYERQQLNASTVAASGWSGILGQAAGEMFDPTEWAIIGGTTVAASALTTPVGGAVTFGAGVANRVRKTYNVFRGARAGVGLGALEATAFEALRAEQRYDTDINDIWIAMGLGATVGGIGGTIGTVLARRKAVSEMSLRLVNGETLEDFSEAEKAFYREFNMDATAMRLLADHADEVGMEGTLGLDDVPMETRDGTVPTMETLKGTTWFRRMASAGARGGTSTQDSIRQLSMKLSHNPGNARDVSGKHVPTEEGGSASEIQELTQLIFRNEFQTTFHSTFSSWKKRTGGTMLEFNTLGARYARGMLDNVDDEVKELADLVTKQERKLVELGIDVNAAGFVPEILERHKNYLPRIFNSDKIRNLRKTLGTNAEVAVAKLVREALLSEQPAIIMDLQASLQKKLKKKKVSMAEAEAKFNSMVEGYTETIMNPNFLSKPSRQTEFDLEGLEEILYNRGHVTDEIDSILEAMTVRNPAKGIKRTKPRLLLNESTVVDVEDANGNTVSLGFSDILEEDIYQLHQAYIFQTSGAIGLARKGINTNDPLSNFEDYIKAIEADLNKRGIDSKDHQAEVSGIRFMYDGITGNLAKNDNVSDKFRENAIALRAFSFAVHMGASGMAAIMELSNVLFDTSVRLNIRAIPELRRIVGLARAGNLGETNIVDEVNSAFGLGEEVALGRYNNANRFDDGNMEGALTPSQAKREWAGIAQQKVAYWSGLQGITQTLRRINNLNFANAWSDGIVRNKIPFSRARLAQLGLSDGMVVDIMDEMKVKSVMKENGRLEQLNLEEWEPKIREAFQAAGYKDTRNNVQEMNIGSTNRTVRTELGKIIGQFLSFPMGAMEHQTMRLAARGKQGDLMGTSRVIMGSALQGTLIYITRVHLNSLGREDREEYLKRNLTLAKISTGALGMVGASSVLGLMYNSGSSFFGYQGNPITPPIFSLVGGAGKSALNIGTDVLTGEDLSSRDIRQVLRIVPGQSLYGISQGLNAVSEELAALAN